MNDDFFHRLSESGVVFCVRMERHLPARKLRDDDGRCPYCGEEVGLDG